MYYGQDSLYSFDTDVDRIAGMKRREVEP